MSNQVSISQDLALARRVLLPAPGLVLFAGGPGSPVAVDPGRLSAAPTDLGILLADFFAGADAASLVQRPVELAVDGPAYPGPALKTLSSALAVEPSAHPLTVYMAAHGDPGTSPGEHTVTLWGGWTLSVGDLVQVLDAPVSRRPMRMVLTSCFGGGFADLIFREAVESATVLREVVDCGLFATTADAQASGCDPDPNRARQESYSIHFLQALLGNDRGGRPLSGSDLDLNGDGRVGLLEAHARARLHSRSIDVPTTTSERWLRIGEGASVSAGAGGYEQVRELLADEMAVVKGLGEQLRLMDRASVERGLARADREDRQRGARLDALESAADDAYFALRIALLERWPVLDRPWLPSWSRALRSEGASIRQLLLESSLAVDYRLQRRALDSLVGEEARAQVHRALLRRLLRAHQNLEMAAALRREGGARWERYLALRRCESAAIVSDNVGSAHGR